MPATAVTDWNPGRHPSSALQVSLLGLTELSAALELQDRITADLAERNDTYGALLLCEHPTGVTFGREGTTADLATDRQELITRGIPVEWLRRGGGTWSHHGGQLMAYLLVPCERLGIDAAALEQKLTASMVDVAQEMGVPSEPSIGARGRCGQFGFVGAALRDGISQFGGCLNVAVPRGALQLVCWGKGVRPSSLAAERMRPIAMSSARECWLRHLAIQFRYDHFHMATGHPWLRRTVRRTAVFVET